MKLSPLIDECAIQEKKIPSKSVGLMNHEMLHLVQYKTNSTTKLSGVLNFNLSNAIKPKIVFAASWFVQFLSLYKVSYSLT